jgi:hypothetical protein
MSLHDDVDRGLAITGQIEKLKAELKDIETRLQMAGLKHPDEHVDLVDADRDGKRWLAKGTERIVPVIFTADLIIGEFGALTPRAQTIRTAARGKLTEFFKPVNNFKNRFDNGKKFRQSAAELLAEAAPNFITACLARDKEGQPKSRIVVAWDETEAVAKPS